MLRPVFFALFLFACGEQEKPKSITKVIYERNFPNKCEQVYESYKFLYQNKDYFFSHKDLTNRFKLDKEIKTGAGGGKVYFVTDKADNVKKVLKIFPTESRRKIPPQENKNTREIIITCELDRLNFNQEFTANQKVNFFPQFYGFGITNSNKPFEPNKAHSNEVFYFILMELVKGSSMYDEAKKKKPFIDKEKTKQVFYQILLALNKAYKDIGFVHMDLHPGNIILTENQPNLLKMIDFGKSTIKQFYSYDKKVNDINIRNINPYNIPLGTAKATRTSSLKLLEFYLLLMGRELTESIVDMQTAQMSYPIDTFRFETKALENMNLYKLGDDIQFLNMMIYTFRNFYEPYKSFANYCRSFFNCKNQFLQ